MIASDFQHGLAQEPYTGLLKTPNALVTEYGQVQFDYSNSIERNTRYIDGYNYMVTTGLFPGLEINGRIATQNNNCNGYTDKNCGIRDLSASAKYQLPFIPYNWFDAAIGGRDIGGAANNFQAYYGVISKEWWQLRFSAGAGKSDSRLGQLSGPFGGVEWQPLDWLQFLAEYDANSVNLGTKVFTPATWSMSGWQAYVSAQTYQQEKRSARDYWFGVGLKAPLWTGIDKKPVVAAATQVVDSKTLKDIDQLSLTTHQSEQPLSSSAHPSDNQPSAISSVNTARDISVENETLQHKLSAAGFENIRINYSDKLLIVAVENSRYNWNELDGIGVALGIMADNASDQTQDLQLILLNQKLPVISVTSSLACTKAYLNGDTCHGQGSFFKVSTRNLHQTLAKLNEQSESQSSSFKPRLVLAPAIRSNVATEYGVLDYSTALSSNLQLPLWQGSMFDIRHFEPIANSDDFGDHRIWANQRYQSDVDRILIHQAFWLPGDLFTKFSAGRILFDYEGIQNESRWESDNGTHRVKLETARFENSKLNQTAKPVLGSYRYYREDWDWSGEITVGQFWYGDKGFKIVSNHWFGDTEVRLFLRDTKEKIAGIEFVIPFSFRQDMKPTSLGQIRGTDQFAYGVETLIGNKNNKLTYDVGITPALTHNVDQVYFNRDRLNSVYVMSHLSRLREAYQKYVISEKTAD